MRILHTSDWHLGRSFHRVGMLEHQAAFVDHLLGVVASEAVDLVVVAGDVYDRALPHVDAVRLADETLARLAASRARVVITSGNHDSAQRLGFGARVMDAAGIHVRTDASSVGTPVVLEDAHGPVAVHGLPFLDPHTLHEPWSLPARTHEAAVAEAMRRVRADLVARPTRSVVLAHAFVAGGLPSESERDISVGGVSVVSSELFADISYTALGHLHGRATLAETVRYSGSPLAYSFSEAAHTKGSWLVDLGADGVTGTTFVEAPVPRRLSVVSGELETLLRDPRLDGAEDHWVQATLTDAVRPERPMERLRERFPHALVLGFAPAGEPGPSVVAAAPGGRSDHEVALDFVAAMRGGPADEDESALLLRACDACADDPEADLLLSAGGSG
ncbi:MAG TPA: exonuclease SbcCD subunit D [Nocardioides sp.]|jgi:exonuclease SbcD|nr:exonuclease SbcCD subunit D [Nocardioides sp.]